MKKTISSRNLIGIFDSGVGGLSVLREIRSLLPSQSILYVGDQHHVPYGKRQPSEVRKFSTAITQYLLDAGAVLIIVACNTASAASLKELRHAFPKVPFVGMEPAVKPASQQTHNGVVGVLATPATFQGELYATLVEKFATDVKILTNTIPGLVEEIENGNLGGYKTRSILEGAIKPMLAQGADTLVLGCTHYPFVLPMIRDIAGPGINVIDPAPAIARRTKSLLEQFELASSSPEPADMIFTTTGSLEHFKASIDRLLNLQVAPIKLVWNDDNQRILEKG